MCSRCRRSEAAPLKILLLHPRKAGEGGQRMRRRCMLGLLSAELQSSVERELWRAKERLARETLREREKAMGKHTEYSLMLHQKRETLKHAQTLRETILTLACVSWVRERRREAERDRRGELKGDDSAEEQVSLSPPLK